MEAGGKVFVVLYPGAVGAHVALGLRIDECGSTVGAHSITLHLRAHESAYMRALQRE